MTPKECQHFDAEIRREVCALWNKEDKKNSKSGFAVFYGPLSFRTELMLIGLNPGGGEEAHFVDEANELKPRTHQKMEYAEIEGKKKEDYRLACVTRDLFKKINCSALLEKSVKLNLHFFRSKKWTDLPKDKRFQCLGIVKKIIEKLEPQVLICEGVTTYDIVKNHELAGKLCEGRPDFYGAKGNNRLFVFAHTKGEAPKSVIGIVHLSGARGVGEVQKSTIGRSLEPYLSGLNVGRSAHS